MDIVEWDEDPAIFIANSLNPAEAVDVIFDLDNPKACTVVVPDYQLSLAIGKRGQNARLAAKLTGFKIDIKSETDMEEFYAKLEEGAYIDAADEVETLDEAVTESDLTADEYENVATEAAEDEATAAEEVAEANEATADQTEE